MAAATFAFLDDCISRYAATPTSTRSHTPPRWTPPSSTPKPGPGSGDGPSCKPWSTPSRQAAGCTSIPQW